MVSPFKYMEHGATYIVSSLFQDLESIAGKGGHLVLALHIFFFFKIPLGIYGKMPKGYKELIQDITIIPSSTDMSKSPHAATLPTKNQSPS
mgnify:CR=1 FL=1